MNGCLLSSEAFELVRTVSGTCVVRSRAAGETWHPVAGPADEARTLYVEGLRLRERLAEAAGPLVIWDVGLGAGGNALAVLRALAYGTGRVDLVSFDRTRAGLAFARRHAAELGYFAGFEGTVDALLKDGLASVGRGGFCAQQLELEVQLGEQRALGGGRAPQRARHQQQRVQRDPVEPLAHGEAVALREVRRAQERPRGELVEGGVEGRPGFGLHAGKTSTADGRG
jgi:hypothetical protein